MKGVNGVGLALEVGVTAGRLGSAPGAGLLTTLEAVGIIVGVILFTDFEQPVIARAINTQIKLRFIMIIPFLKEYWTINIVHPGSGKELDFSFEESF